MKKLLFYLLAITGLSSMMAQPGWEVHWSGYTTESRGISRIAIYDANVAWAVAYDGSSNQADISAVSVTNDGGITWTAYDPVSLPGAVNPGISMVFPTSPTTAYIAAYKRSFGNGGVWKTTDGGANWIKSSSSSMYSNSASFCNIVFFTDANNGFCQGDPIGGEFEMYSTTDGGTTWTPISGNNIDDPLAGEYGYTGGITSAGGTIWFTTNKGRLYRSTDNGATWTAHQTPLTDFGGSADNGSVTFKDANEGWIIRDNGELYHTTDAGDTWTLMSPTGKDDMSGDIAYVPGIDRLIIADADYNHTSYGTAYSDDGGQTWTKMIYYRLGPDDSTDWYDITSAINGGQLQHTAIAALDENTILSGTFSHQDDPNDPNDFASGIYRYVHDVSGFIVGVDDAKVENLNIYPNPAKDIIYVSAANDINSITIYDMTGKEVISLKDIAMNQTSVNIQDLKQGFYLIKVIDNKGAEQTNKLVIK